MASSAMDGTREEVIQTFCSQLQILKGNVDYEISTFREETEQNTESVLLCKRRISASYEKYSNVANEYEDFILKGNTTGDLEILESFRAARSELHNTTITTLRDIRELLQRLRRTSPSSVGSRSRASTNIIKVKAKAEAAKAALEFATKEAELKKADAEIHFKRMSLQANLELLHRQKDVAVAVAEYNVTLEADSNKDVDSLLEIPRENTFKRTEQYVIDHTGSNATLGYHEKLQDSNVQENAQPAQPILSACRRTLPTSVISSASMANMSNRRSIGPVHMESTCNMENPSNTALNEFSRFLLKKDLLMSRFSKFNDKPESYGSWKSSFQTITTELQVTVVEESELLVKWLGPDSSKFAYSIRISNANNPSRGLLKIWNRLNERYGSPELIETSLRTKRNNFQRITYKDLKRLYELQDILSERESTKENPDCEKLLSNFDTSVGVNPIVNKLPLALQGKWRDKASNYKRVNGVAFPPFSLFLEFVSEQARKYNDPQ